MDGGSHDADNLTLLCDGHHKALHDGKLTITGKAPDLEVRWLYPRVSAMAGSGERSSTHVGHVDPPKAEVLTSDRSHLPAVAMTHVGRSGQPSTATPPRGSRFAIAALKVEVKRALVKMGFNQHEAAEAAEAAATKLGDDATLETLLFASLQRCPKPYR